MISSAPGTGPGIVRPAPVSGVRAGADRRCLFGAVPRGAARRPCRNVMQSFVSDRSSFSSFPGWERRGARFRVPRFRGARLMRASSLTPAAGRVFPRLAVCRHSTLPAGRAPPEGDAERGHRRSGADRPGPGDRGRPWNGAGAVDRARRPSGPAADTVRNRDGAGWDAAVRSLIPGPCKFRTCGPGLGPRDGASGVRSDRSPAGAPRRGSDRTDEDLHPTIWRFRRGLQVRSVAGPRVCRRLPPRGTPAFLPAFPWRAVFRRAGVGAES